MLRIQLDGRTNLVCSYLKEIQRNKQCDIILQEIPHQDLASKYLRVNCYMNYHPDCLRNNQTVSLYTKNGQEVQIPLSNALCTKIGEKITVVTGVQSEQQE